MRISAADVTFGGSVAAPNTELAGRTITGPGAITATSAFTWTGGTMAGSGSTNIPAGARLAVDDSLGSKNLSARTINNAGTATVFRSQASDFGISFSNG